MHVHVGGSIPVSKKVSLRPNRQQKSILEGSFTHLCYIDKTTLKELALQTGLRDEQVARWFKNKRLRGKCKGPLSLSYTV